MTSDNTWVTAGLVFLGTRDLDVATMGKNVADTLERLDETVRSVRVLPDGSALVKSDRYYVRLCTDRDKPVAALDTPASSWLELRVSQAPDAGRCAHSARHRTLARVVASLQRELQADFIQWLKPETMLTREQFASAVETTDADRAKRRAVAGRRQRAAQRPPLPEIEQTAEDLHNRMSGAETGADPADAQAEPAPEHHDAPHALDAGSEQMQHTPTLRLSAWLVSYAVALFSLPVGACLITYNLIRGESLRLTSQTAALTGTFIAFQAFGTTAQALEVMQAAIL